jgi:hypothetical protein
VPFYQICTALDAIVHETLEPPETPRGGFIHRW